MNPHPRKIRYGKPCMVKLRGIIAKHFISVPVEALHAMNFTGYKVDILLSTKMHFFKEALASLLPYGGDFNIREKLETINKNLFLNDFLYTLLD